MLKIKTTKSIIFTSILLAPAALAFLVGYPLSPIDSKIAAIWPPQTDLCFKIGDLNSLLQCQMEPHILVRGKWLLHLLHANPELFAVVGLVFLLAIVYGLSE